MEYGVRYLPWLRDFLREPLALEFPVGQFSDQPTKLQLIVGDVKTLDVVDHYFYQRGDHYHYTGNKATLGLIAPGIFRHAVLRPFGGSDGIVATSKSPRDDDLTVL